MIEGYCVRCKQSNEMENPQAVWTRRGMPATRGECPDCGGTIFRMGRTELHDGLQQPDAVQVAGNQRLKLNSNTVYINFANADHDIAHQLAHDLEKVGIAVWLHEHQPDDVQWAGGVHPALTECRNMVYVLSAAALKDEAVDAACQYFKAHHKPVVIAQVEQADPPDTIRRSPRYDMLADYKLAFRRLVQDLSE